MKETKDQRKRARRLSRTLSFALVKHLQKLIIGQHQQVIEGKLCKREKLVAQVCALCTLQTVVHEEDTFDRN